MSFILNALEKSEKERQLRENPHLHVVHGYPVALKKSSSRSRWQKYILSVLALLLSVCVGVFVFLYWPQIPKGFKKEVLPVVRETIPPPMSIIKGKEKVLFPPPPLLPTPEPKNDSFLLALKNLPVAEHDEIAKRYSISRSYIDGGVKHTIVINNKINFIHLPTEKSPEALLPLYAELSPSLQNAIPELHFAGHTYSNDPAKRMIIVNNNILREGEKIDQDMRLVKITWEGVILEFKGRKFKKIIQ